MHINTKVATCCYCGKKAALVLKGRTRHELACSGCGAPLHNLKMIKTTAEERSKGVERSAKAPFLKHPRGKPTKRKPAFSRRLIGKLFDEIEDVFDDIFD
jgi:hypothetical protein